MFGIAIARSSAALVNSCVQINATRSSDFIIFEYKKEDRPVHIERSLGGADGVARAQSRRQA